MNLLDQVHWIQEVRFDRSRSGPSNIDAGHGARFCKDHGAAGRPFRARDLPDFDPGNIGQTTFGAHGGPDTSLLLAGGHTDCRSHKHGDDGGRMRSSHRDILAWLVVGGGWPT